MWISFLSLLTVSFLGGEFSALVGSPYVILRDSQFDNGFPEAEYQKIIKTVQEVYGPIVSEKNGELKILADWSDGAVNMWAERLGDEYWLEVPGGMSRYYLINEVAFVISICHELGHLLGGEPANGFISFEGQSDYYSNGECTTRILDSMSLYQPIEIDDEVEGYCSENKKDFCEEILQGSKSLTSYYAELEGSDFPQLDTPSSSIASETFSQHPKAQCRLDTLLASFFGKDRPRCWFID